MYKEDGIDARPFREIYGKGDEELRKQLRKKLIESGCAGTPQTVNNWGRGDTTPHPLIQKTVAKVVSKEIKKRTLASTLFPV